MKKIIYLVLLFILSLDAQESRENLYNNISLDDDSDLTKETIKQYVNSSFNVSAHKANYFLPFSYRVQDNYNQVLEHNYRYPPKQLETEFQISIKYDVGSNIFGLDEIYTVAYTQKSFWQLYTDSAYFRESNYNPEVFLTFPLRLSKSASGLRGLRLGLAHQSNGLGSDLERSWNYIYTDVYFQLRSVFVDLKLWYSARDSLYYNPNLLDYLSNGYLRFIIPYRRHILEAKFTYTLDGYGSSALNYSHPVFGRKDLFLYVKAFNGYGESLIDYDTKVSKLGIGFSISR